MNSRIILTSLAAIALTAVTACGGSTPGQAKPASGTATSPSSSSTTSSGATNSTSANSTDDSLKDTDPCSLLTSNEAAKLGASAMPERKKIVSSETCLWHPTDASLFVGTRTNVGLSGIQPTGEVTDATVGRHQAKQVRDITGSCIIAIGVTSSSRVDITFNGNSKTDPCIQAMQAAKLVEPKLP